MREFSEKDAEVFPKIYGSFWKKIRKFLKAEGASVPVNAGLSEVTLTGSALCFGKLA
jgi:hypothetical protein